MYNLNYFYNYELLFRNVDVRSYRFHLLVRWLLDIPS